MFEVKIKKIFIKLEREKIHFYIYHIAIQFLY